MQVDASGELNWNNLFLYRQWPEMDTKKVPSAYSYSPSTSARRRKQWGHDIDDESEVMRWTKLQLQPRTPTEEIRLLQDLTSGLQLVRQMQADGQAMIQNRVPRHLSRTAREVVRDYLDEVARQWRTHMTTGSRVVFESVPLDIVVTHPAVRPETGSDPHHLHSCWLIPCAGMEIRGTEPHIPGR